MNEEILQNIFNILSDDPDIKVKANNFEEWKNTFLFDDGIQNNVHSYLLRKELTNSDINTWKSNIGIGRDTEDPQQTDPLVLDLPKVTRKDVRKTEEIAIMELRQKYEGLGFEFEETGATGDWITIKAPLEYEGQPDEERATEEFSFDMFWGNVFGADKREAKRLNDFVQKHYKKSEELKDIDADVYTATINNTIKLEKALPEDKKLKDMGPKALETMQQEAFYNVLGKEGVWENVLKEINPTMDAYQREQMEVISKKYDLTTNEGVDSANKELSKLLKDKEKELLNNSKEYKKLLQSVNAAVVSRYGGKDIQGSLINRAYTLEAEEELLPFTAGVRKVENWLYDGDAIADYMQGFGTGRLQVAKGTNDWTEITMREQTHQEFTEELSALKKRLEDGEDPNTEHVVYPPVSGFQKGVPIEPLFEGTIQERIKELEKSIPENVLKISEGISKSLKYQKKLSRLDPAEIFDGDMFDPQLTTDEFQKMVGTQVLQAISSIFVLPSIAQETGGIAIETLEVETARDMFPGASDKDALEAFRMIQDDEVKKEAMLSVIENGQVDFGPAVKGGFGAASLDIAGNFFMFSKAYKLAPKSVLRDFYTKGIKGVLKNKGFQGLAAATGIETVTEYFQEEIAMYSVKAATGYKGDLHENMKRRLESAGQAFLTTPVITAGPRTTQVAINEFRAEVLNGNRKEARTKINKKKEMYQQAYDDGIIDIDERNDMFTELEAIEDIINNVNVYKKMKGDSKEITINSMLEINNLKKKKKEFQNDNEKIKKENPGAPLKYLQQDNNNRIKDVEKQIAEKNEAIIKERIVTHLRDDARLAEYINLMEEGEFKGKKFKKFKDKKEALEYFSKLFDEKSWLVYAERLEERIQGYINKGLKPKEARQMAYKDFESVGNKVKLNQMLGMKRLYNGEANANVAGNTAFVIMENTVERVRKGDPTTMNAFHHEALHFVQENMGVPKLKEIKLAIEKELAGSKDPKMLLIAKYASDWFKKRGYTNIHKNKKDYYLEWFANLSDAMKYVNFRLDMNDNASETMFNVGKLFGNMFRKQTQMFELDWSKFDAGNALEYLQKWNDFRGEKGPVLNFRMPRGKVHVDEEDKKLGGKVLASEGIYYEINETFKEYSALDKELASNVTADMMQGIVFDRLINLKNAGLIEGFSDKDLEEIQLQFTGPIKDLPDNIKNRGAVALLMKYDEDFKGGVMGYFNATIRGRKMLDMRLQEFVENHPKYGNIQVSMQEEGVTKAVEAQETALSPEEIMIQKEEKKAKKRKRKPKKKQDVMLNEELSKRGFKEAKDIHDFLVEEYTKLHEAGKLEGMTLADLKKIGEAKIQEMFGVKPKPGNLTKDDVKASQMAVKKLGKDFFVNYVFGKHHTEGVALRDANGMAVVDKDGNIVIDPKTKELSTGLPQVLQSERPTKKNGLKQVRDTFFESLDRGKNLKLKRLKKFDDNYFYEKYGILSDDPNLYKKTENISQLHRGTHARVLQVMASQAARQVLPAGRSFDLLADGLSDVMFSEGLLLLDDNTFSELFAALPELGMRIRPFVNDYKKEHLKAAVKTVLSNFDGKKITLVDGKEVIASTYITNQLDKMFSRYASQVVRFSKINKTPVDINEYILNEVLDQESSLLQLFTPKIDGKNVKTIETLWNDKDSIQAIRDSVRPLVEKLGEMYGVENAIRFAIAYLNPMFAGASKIGDGRFDVDINGNLIENKNWEPTKIKKGKKVPQDNRKQAFKNVEDFITHGVNGAIIDGKRIDITFKPQTRKGKTFQVIDEIFVSGKKIEVDTGYLAQNSKTFINKIKKLTKKYGDRKKAETEVKNLSKKEAKEAREFVHDMIVFYKEKENNNPMVMMLNSINSNMKTAMRRAANLKYVTDGYDTVVDPNQDLEYEHMIPANWMMIRHVQAVYDGTLNKDNLAEFYKEYNVAIIPKKMDLVLKESGYNSTMPATYKFGDPSWVRYYNNRTLGKSNIVAIRELGTKKYIGKTDEKLSKMLDRENIDNTKKVQKAVGKARPVNSYVLESRGMSAFDFDETLIDKGENFIVATKDKETVKISSSQWPILGPSLTEQGYKFNFDDFINVRGGVTGPLMQKFRNRIKKYGIKNNYILTARPAESAPAIQAWLKQQGISMPLENITGLGNSTGDAKAMWIAEKFSEGYNDIYFVDDALPNVEAVKNVLEQLDIKGSSVQAKVKFSEGLNENFNNILEDVVGIESKKRFSAIKARKRGESKGKFRFFIPPSHEDFVGLLYNFMGKGKKGNAHRDFFEKALIQPLNRAYRELNTAKQSIANDYKSLNKEFKDVKKKLTKKTPDGDFTYQDAIRVYLWDKHGEKVPGLSPTDQKNLVDLVKSDPELKAYADALNIISKQEKYVAPTESWEAGDIRTDLDDATGRIGRAEFFAEFFENADIIFSQENLNKIEAAYGADMVSALKDILYRTKTGRNRPSGQNKVVNQFMNWLNGSVAATMFFNIRSSVLQQMSMVNFINFADNNIFAAAKAFANQKQYWADWAYIFNSDFMKQRRGGIKTDVNGAELAASVKDAKNPVQAIIKKLLELGFLPTQIGDNIAIATGGSTFYRNRINTYLKQGLSKKEAQEKAWIDFQVLAEATQQSARPDMVSQQQASPLGKVILAFQNVTSQFNRLGKKAFLDIKNRRITPGNTTQLQSDMSNLSRIAYYFAIQNLIFYSLQSALFMAMFDDDEEDEKFLKKKERMINGSIDSVLRGSGVWGATVATLKNMAIKRFANEGKDWNADPYAVMTEALQVSPPLGIKARKSVQAEKDLIWNKKTIEEMETFDIDNPMWSAYTSHIESLTNIPLNRLYNKTQNVRESLDNQHNALERVLLFSGWSKWNLGIEDVKKSKKKQKFGTKKSKEKTRKPVW
jgi:hypothetical protein